MSSGLSNYARRLLMGASNARREFDRPVLVWEVANVEDSDQRWQRTQLGGAETQPAVGEPLVFEVRKALGKVNAFAHGVTVGRSNSNDVVIVDTSVSRFHAYLQKDRKAERWTVVDAESKFGTFIGEKQLTPNEPTFVEDRAKIRFGQVELHFFLPESFFAYIEAKAND